MKSTCIRGDPVRAFRAPARGAILLRGSTGRGYLNVTEKKLRLETRRGGKRNKVYLELVGKEELEMADLSFHAAAH